MSGTAPCSDIWAICSWSSSTLHWDPVDKARFNVISLATRAPQMVLFTHSPHMWAENNINIAQHNNHIPVSSCEMWQVRFSVLATVAESA